MLNLNRVENIKYLANQLESGKYKQGFGAMKEIKNGDAFHCIHGVMCEAYKDLTGDGEWSDAYYRGTTKVLKFSGGSWSGASPKIVSFFLANSKWGQTL